MLAFFQPRKLTKNSTRQPDGSVGQDLGLQPNLHKPVGLVNSRRPAQANRIRSDFKAMQKDMLSRRQRRRPSFRKPFPPPRRLFAAAAAAAASVLCCSAVAAAAELQARSTTGSERQGGSMTRASDKKRSRVRGPKRGLLVIEKQSGR
jgi:hypothetical protein